AEAEVVPFAAASRPERAPRRCPPPGGALDASRRPDLRQPPDLSGHSIVFAMFSLNEAEETACLRGDYDWTNDPSPRMAALVARHVGARPLCFSARGALTGTRLPSGEYVGLVGAVHSGKADLLFFDTYTDAQWYRDSAVFYPHVFEHYCMYVRKSRAVPFLERARGAFSGDVWAAAGAALAALWAARLAAGERPAPALFRTYAAFLTGAFALGRPRRRSRLRRALSWATALYGCLLLSVFQSSFTSYLAAPEYEPNLATLSAVAAHVSDVFVYEGLSRRLQDDRSAVIRRLARKFRPTLQQDAWLAAVEGIVRGGGRAALPLLRNHLNVRQCRYSAGGYSPLHRVAECVFTTSFTHYVGQRHSPYASRLDALVQRALQMRARFGLVRLLPGARPLRPYPLRRAHLRVAFRLLGAGWAAAAAAALAEALCARHVARSHTHTHGRKVGGE
ncbi:Uncharacterized protein GBIM_17342, partial [Gryllus bimaculatus]